MPLSHTWAGPWGAWDGGLGSALQKAMSRNSRWSARLRRISEPSGWPGTQWISTQSCPPRLRGWRGGEVDGGTEVLERRAWGRGQDLGRWEAGRGGGSGEVGGCKGLLQHRGQRQGPEAPQPRLGLGLSADRDEGGSRPRAARSSQLSQGLGRREEPGCPTQALTRPRDHDAAGNGTGALPGAAGGPGSRCHLHLRGSSG